jgi:hypothetical protein
MLPISNIDMLDERLTKPGELVQDGGCVARIGGGEASKSWQSELWLLVPTTLAPALLLRRPCVRASCLLESSGRVPAFKAGIEGGQDAAPQLVTSDGPLELLMIK